MVAVLEKAVTVYKKGQTTLPVEVRHALDVVPGDSVTFLVDDNGAVQLRKTDDGVDPVTEAFLHFLAEEMKDRPSGVRPLTTSLEQRLREITAATQIDRDTDVIEGDVGL